MDRDERTPTALDLLRRAEQAMTDGRPRQAVQRLLEETVSIAKSDPATAHLAHRYLGELLLQTSPWNASLNLRLAIALSPNDDASHALMALAQSLLGNFRVAVASYRRALAIAPRNPWYNHNLGHLLDVALDAPQDGLAYLERAHRTEPGQEDVLASLAHCLGRVGQKERALEIAQKLVQSRPDAEDRASLLRWLLAGAPASPDPSASGLLASVGARTIEPPQSDAGEPVGTPSAEVRMVVDALTAAMRANGRDPRDIHRACTMWRDYAQLGQPVAGRPATFAAAIEYALSRVDGSDMRQKDIAARYGVSLSSLQSRYATLRISLNLMPRDPRYLRRESHNRA